MVEDVRTCKYKDLASVLSIADISLSFNKQQHISLSDFNKLALHVDAIFPTNNIFTELVLTFVFN